MTSLRNAPLLGAFNDAWNASQPERMVGSTAL